MRRRALLLALTGLLAPRSAQAGILCDWFGRCLYESPGFRITVVDAETSQPLAGVHALAEWVQHAAWGQDHVLMVQDAVSTADGLLAFSAWGPLRGSSAGLAIGKDPVLTLFKPGYQYVVIPNATPRGTKETDRLHPFGMHGRSLSMTRHHGPQTEWAKELQRAASIQSPTISPELLRQFRGPYLARFRRVWAEVEKLPQEHQAMLRRTTHLEYRLQLLESSSP